MNYTMIEVKQLEASPDNARRTVTKTAIEELKASILAHGLMQNLVVTDAGDGRYRVIAGGRRLEALCQLQQEHRLPETHAVPCQVVSGERAHELSLAENTVRQAMHPADEFEAFARLAEDGRSVGEISERFGVTARHVEQRLKLGRVAPELLAAYRAEELTLESLMAFTITADHDKQLEVHESLAPWQAGDPGQIRAMLTGELPEASDRLAKFVGLDAYHAAGGVSRADLFGEDIYLESPELLHRLVGEKLNAVREELEAEGWKWVEVNPERDWDFMRACGRIHPKPAGVPQELHDARQQAEDDLEALQQAQDEDESDTLTEELEEAEARLAAIEEQIEAFLAYDPEEMRSAGCYVSIDYDGELSVEKGLVGRADLKEAADRGDHRPKPPKGLPESLRRDLEAYRLQAAQVEIATHRLVALDLLAFTIARRAVAHRPIEGGPDVVLVPHYPTQTVQKERTVAGEALKAIAERLPCGWMEAETEAEQFQAFLNLSDRERLDFLAYGVATSLKPQLSLGHEDGAYEFALSLNDADLARYWRPTKANYLGRITRDQLLALGRDLLGEQWASARSRYKKGELADALEAAFAQPENVACTPERREALKRWLPGGMSFGAEARRSENTTVRQAA